MNTSEYNLNTVVIEVKTITIRVDEELFKEIEAKKGDKNKSDFLREIISEYLKNTAEDKRIQENTIVNTGEYERIRDELKHKEEIIQLKEERILDLQTQLGWLQMEHSKLSDRIPALPAPKKRRLRFWKK